MKKILISNDDGVLAPGIFAAKEAVKDLGEVIVVAPQENNSGVGRRLSMFKLKAPLIIFKRERENMIFIF